MIFQSIQQLTLRLLRNFGKPLFNLLKCKKNNPFRSRKTLPCIKGIETMFHLAVFPFYEGRKTLPCIKGIETTFIVNPYSRRGRKTLPCIKGIETLNTR